MYYGLYVYAHVHCAVYSVRAYHSICTTHKLHVHVYLGASDKNPTVDKLRGDLKDKPRKESILETQDEH